MFDKKTQENFGDAIPFEPDYELIKTNPNEIYFKYEPKIAKLTKGLSWFKSFERDELTQQAYVYFITLCEAYDPYYMGHFYPFDRYLFKNLIIKLRAFIQRFYFKGRREKPSDRCEYLLQNATVDDIGDYEGELHRRYIYSLLNERQREILSLTLEGYKQQEIGKQMGISQSRVSVIKKKGIEQLYDILDETHSEEEKNELRINELKKTLYSK